MSNRIENITNRIDTHSRREARITLQIWVRGVALAALLVCGGEVRAQAAIAPPFPAWRDTAQHRVRSVRVEPGVTLEVLEWGGTGSPLIFLAGSGNAAHVFDGFAPRFTSRFRVLGVTRRGTGASSHPAAGYDSATLARDLIAVLDALGVRRASFAAHSFGGSELHYLAAHHHERVEQLVYLDAAYDYHALMASPENRSGQLQTPEPPIPAYDDNTARSWTLFAERVSGPGYPEAEVRAMYAFDTAGRYQRPVNIDSLQARLDRGTAPVDLRQISAPTLAIYAIPGAVETMFPYWAVLDSVGRERAVQSHTAVTALLSRLRAQFPREVPQARVVVIPGARHYVFLTHPGEVEHAMLEFLSPAARP
ncbi:MAG: alpha/beta hydrolase [Gemmatimonadaceae bacterium]|nr:alpha/beta hydrolase [Gemmatimonadaceae bacterium]